MKFHFTFIAVLAVGLVLPSVLAQPGPGGALRAPLSRLGDLSAEDMEAVKDRLENLKIQVNAAEAEAAADWQAAAAIVKESEVKIDAIMDTFTESMSAAIRKAFHDVEEVVTTMRADIEAARAQAVTASP